MKKQFSSILFMTLMAVLLALGCSPHYVITTPLQETVSPPSSWSVGVITDQLPADFDPAKKPTVEDIESFKEELRHQLQKIDILDGSNTGSMSPVYEIQGGILDYKKGNGFVRFMFGFGAGAARLIVELKVIDIKKANTVFAGNFTGQVTDGTVSGQKMWENVAKDFAKAVKKEQTRLAGKK